jgi:hypothetical protein
MGGLDGIEKTDQHVRHALEAMNDLIGTDRADVHAELVGLFEEARVAVGGERSRFISAGRRHTGVHVRGRSTYFAAREAGCGP